MLTYGITVLKVKRPFKLNPKMCVLVFFLLLLFNFLKNWGFFSPFIFEGILNFFVFFNFLRLEHLFGMHFKFLLDICD